MSRHRTSLLAVGVTAGVDRFWIQVKDKDGNLLLLTMTRPADVNAQTLEGGNIVVPHGG